MSVKSDINVFAVRNGVNEDSESQQLTEVCDSHQTMEEFCQVGQDFCKALSQDPSIVKAYNVTMLQKVSRRYSVLE